ncbi:MAG: ABC-type amino acid transport substrate-binding protein [Bacteroidia bacterium]|jgi:ABC-type amino acid transport substrate-binding protein
MSRKLVLFVFIMLAPMAVLADALRVGMSVDYPPLAYKQEGRVVGIEADNALAVAKLLGRELKILELPFEGLIAALQDGQIDIIMSGMSITAQRSEQVVFAEPFLDIGQMAITLTRKAGRFAKPWAIYQDDVRVGVEPGTTGAAFAEEELPNAQIVHYAKPDEAFNGLRKDEVDVYIHDAPTSWQLARQDGNRDLISLYHPLTSEQLAWAVSQKKAALIVDINRALAKLKSNGTLGYILNRWIPVRVEVK